MIVPVIKCKQFDTGRRIGVRMTDNGKVFDISGSTLRIFCKKADGKLVYNNAEVVSDNEAIFCITSQMTAATGKLLVEIEIINGDDVISTPIVMFDVLPSNISDQAVESSNEFVALNDVIQRGEECIVNATTATQETIQIKNEVQNKLDNGDFIGPPGIQGEQGPVGPQGPDGVAVITQLNPGLFAVAVDSNGHLIVTHNDNEPVPPLEIQEGRLVYTVRE
ncbi:BppU family phage baseplate upper protein [Diplocloster hominis]|uniref:BppU family phage baseplate upper protein n=1 Tax=Diplocloster hominis TaxID=3079010 RepID=UPI0031B9BC29